MGLCLERHYLLPGSFNHVLARKNNGLRNAVFFWGFLIAAIHLPQLLRPTLKPRAFVTASLAPFHSTPEIL
jgi:hypothetical protein